MSAKTAKPAAKTPTVTNVEVASLQVSLPQMLDLALGTPEVGAVNLNILHNFLHVLLHQINLRSTKVEYRGDDANRIKTMVSSLKAGPSLHLHEYSITDASGKMKQRIHSTDNFSVNVDVITDGEAKSGKPKSAPVTGREKSQNEKEAEAAAENNAQEGTGARKTPGARQQISPGKEGESERVIFVEPIVDGIAPTALGFKQLEHSVNELQQRFQALEELATNAELVERLKGKITDPLTDVWQIINITKRLDASEQGIDKLTTMVQDVIKGDASFTATEDTSPFNERLTNLENTIHNIEQAINNLQVIADMTEEEQATAAPQVPHTPGAVDPASHQAEETHQPTGTTEAAAKTTGEHPAPQRLSLSKILGGVDIPQMHGDVTALKTEVSQMRKTVNELNEKVTRLPAEIEKMKAPVEGAAPTQQPVADKKTQEVERKEKQSTEAQEEKSADATKSQVEIGKEVQAVDQETLKKINQRIEKLEKDVTTLSEKVESTPVAGMSGDSELNELVSKIQGIQGDMEKLNQTADHLIDDKEAREVHLNALLEQVELLKTIKADKEDLEDALADKADAQVLNRKVSHDQFDAACDDLARGLEDAIDKLGKQESIWQEALNEVQKEIEGKVDKIEMSPLKDFLTNRLKTVQEKLKSIADLKRESEAAGTKKMLRDVQCISCDKNVVMKMEDVHKFHVEPLPGSMSMKPYLTYELDKVRKQQRRLPHSRNMIQFEAAMLEDTKKQKSARTEPLVKTPRDHLCNRYCGGSHTVTTPQQRVMRVGHFLSEWGPQVVQLTEGLIQGKDGKMYRSRPLPGKSDVCGPSYCSERIDEEEVQASDRPSVSAAATPRKSAEKRISVQSATRKRSSRKSSTPAAAKEPVEEQVQQVQRVSKELPPVAEKQESISDTLPLDQTTLADEIVQYDDDEVEQEDE